MDDKTIVISPEQAAREGPAARAAKISSRQEDSPKRYDNLRTRCAGLETRVADLEGWNVVMKQSIEDLSQSVGQNAEVLKSMINIVNRSN